MSLSCSCDQGPEVYRESFVKARKEHTCFECRATIAKGDEYQYIFGVWDYGADSFHTCEKCADLRDSLQDLGFCMDIGNLQEDYKEYLEEYAPPKIQLKEGDRTNVSL